MKKSISTFCILICIVGLIAYSEKNNAATILGKWEEKQGRAIMELTIDGKVLDTGNEVGTYEMVDANKIKIHSNGQEIEINYELDEDTLKWGTNFDHCQEFKRMKK